MFDNFLKTAMLCKIAPRLSESMIFKVLEGLEKLQYLFIIFWCLVSGLAWESFFMDFGSILRSSLAPKIHKNMIMFGIDF